MNALARASYFCPFNRSHQFLIFFQNHQNNKLLLFRESIFSAHLFLLSLHWHERDACYVGINLEKLSGNLL